MRIVHVEDFIHPDAGYQLNLLAPLQQAQGNEVFIVTAELNKIPSFLTAFFGKDAISQKDTQFERETGVKIVRVPLIGFFSGRAIFRPSLFKRVSELKPDAVFVHGEDTLTGIAFIMLSRWLRYPLVLDCHMLEMASLNRFREYFRSFYRRFITPIILREGIPLIRVVDSDFVEKCLGIPLSYTDLLSFGTDTLRFRPDAEARRRVRQQLGVNENAFLVVYAGKLDETKGGKLLAEALMHRFAGPADKPIEFLVVGNSDGEYGREVERAFGKSENKIVRLPTQPYRALAQFYQAADLAVFPRQCSMSYFEIQACGVPVLFEENEINRQRVVADNAFLFQPELVKDLREKIVALASLRAEVFDQSRASARKLILENYDYVPIARKFTEVIERARAAWLAKGRRGFGTTRLGARRAATR